MAHKIHTRSAVAAATLLCLQVLSSPAQVQASPLASLTGTAELSKIRVANHETYQRIVLDTSAAVTWSRIEGTQNLTLEIKGLTSDDKTRVFSDLGPVKGLRIEAVADNAVHIIFDLTAPMKPRITGYTPDTYGGHRIVIDLWPTASQPKHLEQKPPKQPGPQPSVPVDVPVLKETSQWPDVLGETHNTLVPKETSPLLPEHTGSDLGPEHDLETILGDEPDAKGIMGAMVARNPLAVAREKLALGAPRDACKVIQTNFPKGTWNIEAMMLEGECLRALGSLTKANLLYTEVLSLDPANVQARLGLAQVQVGNGDFAAARDNFTRALTKLPPGALADNTRARLKMVEDQLKHAVE